MEVGEEGLTVTTRMMGSDDSHFNVSVGSDGQSHKTVSTNHNLFEDKGERKRYRTDVLPLGQTGSLKRNVKNGQQFILPCGAPQK